jgi:hypothetical protein
VQFDGRPFKELSSYEDIVAETGGVGSEDVELPAGLRGVFGDKDGDGDGDGDDTIKPDPALAFKKVE